MEKYISFDFHCEIGIELNQKNKGKWGKNKCEEKYGEIEANKTQH